MADNKRDIGQKTRGTAATLNTPGADVGLNRPPTDQDVKDYLAEVRAEMAVQMPWAPKAPPNPTSRRFTNEELDDALYVMERLTWAYKTGNNPDADQDALELLEKFVAIAGAVPDIQRIRNEKLVTVYLMDKLASIYTRFTRGEIPAKIYGEEIDAILAIVGIGSTPEILDVVVLDKVEIDNPKEDEDTEATVKGSGPVETARYVLSVLLDDVGFKTKHSSRKLQWTRKLSPAERVRLASSERFGSNVTIARGDSAITTGIPRDVFSFPVRTITKPPSRTLGQSATVDPSAPDDTEGK